MSEIPNDMNGGETLSPADAAALDALAEHGLDPATLGASPVGRLLSLLGTPAAGEDAPLLVDAAFVRALRSAEDGPAALTSRDAEALDSWVMHGYDASRTPAALRDRARRHEALATLVTSAGTPSVSSDLTDRTLTAVQAAIAADEDRMQLRPSVWSRFRMADGVAAAAMLLIAVSVALPAMSSMRSRQQTLACAGNMQATASAMGLYAGANAEALPMATAGMSGRWLDVGTTPDRSNSANLFTLVRTGHSTLDTLACGGNPSAVHGSPAPGQLDWRSLPEVSYSYQVMLGDRPGWRTDRLGQSTVVLADRSPVVIRSVTHRTIDPFAGSPNHAERGQHMLANDGSSRWTGSPVLENGDNIWLPRAVEQALEALLHRQGLIQGTERPQGPGDVFLGP